jgi:hypothetical protein
MNDSFFRFCEITTCCSYFSHAHDELITVKGTVIRSGGVEMIEYDRHQICRKCKYRSACELIQLQLDFVPSLLVLVKALVWFWIVDKTYVLTLQSK